MPDGGKGAPGAGARVWAIGVTVAVLLLGVAIWWAVAGDDDPQRVSRSVPAPSPTGPQYFLLVDLRRVDGISVAGRMQQSRLRAVAEHVRETLTGVYATGFVDTAQWHDGRFPALFAYFADGAQRQARRDLEDLSLGSTARRLDVVRPDRARLGVRVLVGSEGRALSAVATMQFLATGFAGEDREVPIRQQGRYVLRPVGDRWLIVAYDVRGRLGPRGSA
jgi:hypothetical protein